MTHLKANGGSKFFYFDNYSGTNSTGFSGRLYSNCLTLAGTVGTCASTLRFYMSHDILFPTTRDSVYVSVTTNKGATWTRLSPGFARVNLSFANPGWSQETVDLSAYNGQTIQIGFEGVSKYGNIIGIDDITISSSCLLPVTKLDFTGVRSNGMHLLRWSTSTERNNAGFELQRSADGTNFSSLASLPSRADGGNSDHILQYNFTDAKPYGGANYYRLKQTDFDGKMTFSKTVVLRNDLEDSFIFTQLYPNPASTSLTSIIFAPQPGRITLNITDVTGKVIMTQNNQLNVGDNQLQMNTSNLKAGTYFIKAICDKGCDMGVKKFIKK
jgi:hypothetical protein